MSVDGSTEPSTEPSPTAVSPTAAGPASDGEPSSARGAPPSADGGPPRRPVAGVAPRVFYPAAALILLFVVAAVALPEQTAAALGSVQQVVIAGFGWWYVLLIAVFVAFALFVAASRYGRLRLGRDDEEPEFSLRSWFAMLFSAGMGIGLVFWGVAEPLNHFANPRPGTDGTDAELANAALTQTYVHWGVHAWAIYVVVGLAIAYAVHRRGRPISIRWALEPLFGDRIRGRLGDLIDVVAVVGTLFGVATSLGFGVLQLAAGLDFLGVASDSDLLRIGLIAFITGLATISVVSGLARGIQLLSNANMVLAAVILLAVLVLGPTLFLFRELVASLGYYLQDVVRLTFDTSAAQGADGQAWQAGWTMFYWGWWISWAPFVGVFIARISRGRTVREFVVGVLLVPTIVTFAWFAVLGGTALHREVFGGGGLVGPDGAVDTDTSLFLMLDGLPLGGIVSVIALVLIVTFFVTSSDSGSLVIDMLSSGGNTDPPVWSRVFWALTEGAVAAVLLTVGTSALTALQTTAIVVALPFSVVMALMVLALLKALSADSRALEHRLREHQHREIADRAAEALVTAGAAGGGEGLGADSDRQRKDRSPIGVSYPFGRPPSRRERDPQEGGSSAAGREG